MRKSRLGVSRPPSTGYRVLICQDDSGWFIHVIHSGNVPPASISRFVRHEASDASFEGAMAKARSWCVSRGINPGNVSSLDQDRSNAA